MFFVTDPDGMMLDECIALLAKAEQEGHLSGKPTLRPSGKSPRLRTSSSPRYQPFDANADETSHWHSAASGRFCETFDELLSSQKMLEVIPLTTLSK